MEDLRKKVAIYCRVSTQEQAEEGFSIGEQERLIREYCSQKDYVVYDVFSDAGISGKDIKHRPQMKRLLEEAKQKKFDIVMSWKINRLSRKLKDALQIVELLEKCNIAYRSYSEPFESGTPAGKMQFQMMALVGEFERNTLAQNVKMGMCAKARAGEWCGGRAPLGYDWAKMVNENGEQEKKSKLVINKKEAKLVERIFTEFSLGKGYKAIVNQLNKEGYKTKLGNEFSVAQIKPILMNPVYIGKVRYNVRRDWNEKRRGNINPNPIIADGIHDAIIEQELWDKVQRILKNKSGKPSRVYDGEYPLTGILRCPKCGSGMVISRVVCKRKDGSKNVLTYYCCGNWKNKGTAVCHSNMILVEKVHSYVFPKIEELMDNEIFLKEILERMNGKVEHKKVVYQNEVKEIQENLKKLQERRNKIFESYEDGILNKEEFLERKNHLSEQIEQLKKQRGEKEQYLEEERKREVPVEVIKDILKNFGKLLENANLNRSIRKQLLHLLIKEITINEEKEIDSIKIKLTDELILFLQQNGGTPIKGVPSFLMFHSMGIRFMDIELIL